MRRSLRLAEDTQQTRADVKVLQKEVRDLSAKTERETLQARHAHELDVQRLQSQLDRQQDDIQRLRETLQQSREREECDAQTFAHRSRKPFVESQPSATSRATTR